MRLTQYALAHEGRRNRRVGAVMDGSMLDLEAATAAYREHAGDGRSIRAPSSILDLLRHGDDALDDMRRVLGWARVRRATAVDKRMFVSLDECVLDAPLRPGKLITLARNYHEHVAEHGLVHAGKVPSASIKASSSLTGPYDDIARPSMERELDYETELAFGIGRRCKNVPRERAYEVIAGYTVLCDIVARQVLKIERAAGNQFLGKMFDSFGPLGPWIVTKDELPDPMNLGITTRVNGEVLASIATPGE